MYSTDAVKIRAAIEALEQADIAQQEVFPANEFCYELHNMLHEAITTLEDRLTDLEAQAADNDYLMDDGA